MLLCRKDCQPFIFCQAKVVYPAFSSEQLKKCDAVDVIEDLLIVRSCDAVDLIKIV